MRIAFDGDAGVDEYTVTVTVYSRTRSELYTIPSAIRESFQAFKGSSYTAASGTINLTETYKLIEIDHGTSFSNYETKTWAQELSLRVITS